jgi:hypothetical protein
MYANNIPAMYPLPRGIHVCRYTHIRYTRTPLPTSSLSWLSLRTSLPGNLVPVSYILSGPYYTYTLNICISSCIANTISLELVMREDMMKYLLV